jgi:hypothetical protein
VKRKFTKSAGKSQGLKDLFLQVTAEKRAPVDMKLLQNLSATSIAIDFCPDLTKRVRGDGIATVAVGCNESTQIVLIVHVNKQKSYSCLQPHLKAF